MRPRREACTTCTSLAQVANTFRMQLLQVERRIELRHTTGRRVTSGLLYAPKSSGTSFAVWLFQAQSAGTIKQAPRLQLSTPPHRSASRASQSSFDSPRRRARGEGNPPGAWRQSRWRRNFTAHTATGASSPGKTRAFTCRACSTCGIPSRRIICLDWFL